MCDLGRTPVGAHTLLPCVTLSPMCHTLPLVRLSRLSHSPPCVTLSRLSHSPICHTLPHVSHSPHVFPFVTSATLVFRHVSTHRHSSSVCFFGSFSCAPSSHSFINSLIHSLIHSLLAFQVILLVRTFLTLEVFYSDSHFSHMSHTAFPHISEFNSKKTCFLSPTPFLPYVAHPFSPYLRM